MAKSSFRRTLKGVVALEPVTSTQDQLDSYCIHHLEQDPFVAGPSPLDTTQNNPYPNHNLNQDAIGLVPHQFLHIIPVA